MAPPDQITKTRKLTNTGFTNGEAARLDINRLYQECRIYILLSGHTLLAGSGPFAPDP